MQEVQEKISNHQDLLQNLLSQEWDKTEENVLIKALKNGENLWDVLNNLKGFKESFKTEGILNIIKCSDGRVNNNSSIPNDEKLALAGSGLLFSAAENEKFIADNKGKIKVVTSHDECGAAALKFAEMIKNGEALPAGVKTSDELAIHFAKKEALLLGAEYRHIKKEDFSSEIHNERMLIIDGTAKFDANNIPDFPPRFISAALGLGLDRNYVLEEAEALTEISLSDHGFGDRFSQENPFYFVLIAKDQEELDDLKKDFLSLTEKFSKRVKVLGIVAPQE